MPVLELESKEVVLIRETLESVLEGLEDALVCYQDEKTKLEIQGEYKEIKSLLVRLT